jgi:putative ABC transport system substrate-binding protein
VIVVNSSPAIHAAHRATSTIPIVFATSGSPLALGYVSSLSRPGGTVTGLSVMAADLSAKRLELLMEVAGNPSRVAVIWNPDIGDMRSRMSEVQAAKKNRSVNVQSMEVRAPEDFARVFGRLAQERTDALFIMADPLTVYYRNLIVEHAAKLRVPAIYELPDFVDVGGLIAYGPSVTENYRRAATYVDKILKGSKPGDLPIEAPVKFELVVNLKTARAIGVVIPQSVLVRADRIIE